MKRSGSSERGSSDDWNILGALKQLLRGAGPVGLFAGLVTCVLLIALGFIVMTERKAVFDVASAELMGGQKVVAAHVGRTYQAARTLLLLVDEEIVKRKGDAFDGPRTIGYADSLRHLSYELITIRLLDKDGNVIEVDESGNTVATFSRGDLPFFQEMRDSAAGTVGYGPALISRMKHRILPVAIRAHDNASGIAVVAGGLRVADFGAAFEELFVSASAHTGIFDDKGVILATWPWVDELVGQRVPSDILNEGSGSREVRVREIQSLVGAGNAMVGVSDLEGLPLHVFTTFETGELRSRWLKLISLPLLIGALSVAVVIFFSVRIIRLMRQNEQEMARARGALARAKVADVAKKDFLANMSHELRTPLNGIIGFAELMENELFGPLSEQYKSYTGLIVQSGRNLLEIIKEILELSRMEAGIVEVRDEVVDLPNEVQFALMTMHERIRERKLEVDTHFRDGLPQLRIGRAHLKQVLTNLIGNAVKFNVQGGRVVIAGHCTLGEEFVIQVMDGGIGIPRDRLADLFVPFTQVAASESRGHGGLGLGLAMSLTIVRAYGGNISIESDAGKGTTVYVTFPARLAVWNVSLDANRPPVATRSAVQK